MRGRKAPQSSLEGKPPNLCVHCRSPRDPASFNDLAARVSKLFDVQKARLRQAIDWPDSSDPPSSPGLSYLGPINRG